MQQKIYLVLQNGRVFEGTSFGARAEVTGEIVFTTGMAGYTEVITDPANYGNLVVSTFPISGGYGVNRADAQSDGAKVSAFIVREAVTTPSNFRMETTLSEYLAECGVVGVEGVDTRELTKIIRDNGTVNATITLKKPEDVEQIKRSLRKYRPEAPVPAVSAKEKRAGLLIDPKEDFNPPREKEFNVVLLDLGTKYEVERLLSKFGAKVTVVPYHTSAEEILALNPDGVVVSSGPGDPYEIEEVIDTVKSLFEKKIPMFGISLGHLVMALAKGANSVKMKYGHRGENQPVRDTLTNRVYVTAQSHSHVVDAATLGDGLRVSFLNVNDGTVEGIEYLGEPSFSVQFHPEGAGGPKDTVFLFDQFIDNMRKAKEENVCR